MAKAKRKFVGEAVLQVCPQCGEMSMDARPDDEEKLGLDGPCPCSEVGKKIRPLTAIVILHEEAGKLIVE